MCKRKCSVTASTTYLHCCWWWRDLQDLTWAGRTGSDHQHPWPIQNQQMMPVVSLPARSSCRMAGQTQALGHCIPRYGWTEYLHKHIKAHLTSVYSHKQEEQVPRWITFNAPPPPPPLPETNKTSTMTTTKTSLCQNMYLLHISQLVTLPWVGMIKALTERPRKMVSKHVVPFDTWHGGRNIATFCFYIYTF